MFGFQRETLNSLWANAFSNSSINFLKNNWPSFKYPLWEQICFTTCLLFLQYILSLSNTFLFVFFLQDWCVNHINAPAITHITALFRFIRKSLRQKDHFAKCQKAAGGGGGGTTERTRFHCYALWLYTGQVESISSSPENNLFHLKIGLPPCCVIAPRQDKGSQMNEDIVAHLT